MISFSIDISCVIDSNIGWSFNFRKNHKDNNAEIDVVINIAREIKNAIEKIKLAIQENIVAFEIEIEGDDYNVVWETHFSGNAKSNSNTNTDCIINIARELALSLKQIQETVI